MEDLIKTVFFEKEWVTTAEARGVDLEGARLVQEEGREDVWSVRVPEGRYELANKEGLGCGARTLYVRQDGGVVARGLNKFYEYEEVAGDVVRCKEDLKIVSIQRKLAGFIVLIMELNGELVLSTKHTLKGHHTTLASTLLARYPFDAASLISFLKRTSSTLVCEAVSPSDDPWHPVNEPETYHGLSLLTILRKDTVKETTLPSELLQEASELSKIPVVDAVRDPTWQKFTEITQECSEWQSGDDNDTEGFVVTFEIPVEKVVETFKLDKICLEKHDAFKPPAVFRVKVKTLRYRIQRAVRHLISTLRETPGNSKLVKIWSGLPDYQKALLSFCLSREKDFLEKDPKEVDVSKIFKDFEGSLPSEECRVKWVATLKAIRHPVPKAVHTLVLSIGLPGCGKSTILAGVSSHVAKDWDVAYISRDEVTEDERRKRGKADVTRHVHGRVQDLVDAVLENAVTPTVVVADGCHLTKGARNILAKQFSRVVLINFKCSLEEAIGRCRSRTSHPTLDPTSNVSDVVTMMHKRLLYEMESTSPENTIILTIDTQATPIPTAISDITSVVLNTHGKSGLPRPTTPHLIPTHQILPTYKKPAEDLLSVLRITPPLVTSVSKLNYISIAPEATSPWAPTASNIIAAMAKAIQPEVPGSWTASILSIFQGKEAVRLVPVGPEEGSMWLKGAVKSMMYKDKGVRSVLEAIQAMYKVEGFLGNLHCTIAYVGGRLPEDGEGLLGLLSAREELQSRKYKLTCDQLLCDNKGLCLSIASMEPTLPYRTNVEHITLGVTEKGTPRYCEQLCASIVSMEEHNAATADIRSAKKAKKHTAEAQLAEQLMCDQQRQTNLRRKQRFHNCIRMRLEPPVVFEGRLTFNMLE